MDIWNDIKESFRDGSVITRLIYVNLSVFLVFRIIHVFYFLSGQPFDLIQWFELPAGLEQWLRQPWSLVSYMFHHFRFLHILFNLLVLYWFGRIFLDYYDQDHLLGLYLFGGIAGGLLYMAAYNIFPVFAVSVPVSHLLGASTSIIAVLIAAVFRDPDRKIQLFLIGQVPLKYLGVFMIISYILGISTSNAGGNLAHLGGVIAGWLFVNRAKMGQDVVKPFIKSVDWLSALVKPRKKIRIVHRQTSRDDYEYNRQRAADHEELNRILDKIGAEGYDSLTKQDKETLFRHGK